LPRAGHSDVLLRLEAGSDGTARQDGRSSPFDAFCIRGQFIDGQLQAAAQHGAMMLDASGIVQSTDPDALAAGGVPLLAMVYCLIALSLAGYQDRLHNAGRCFKNDAKKTAIDFCYDAMSGSPQPFTAPGRASNRLIHCAARPDDQRVHLSIFDVAATAVARAAGVPHARRRVEARHRFHTQVSQSHLSYRMNLRGLKLCSRKHPPVSGGKRPLGAR
jgi:hypothetical protein